MKVRFLAPYPTFGTKHNPKTASYQRRSPFYWWWAYLRCNDEYLKCCANGGRGQYAKLYFDFGDVRGESFKEWWTLSERGAKLFGEREHLQKLIEAEDISEVPSEWDRKGLMVVLVPLTSTKAYIRSRFSALIKRRHLRQRGRIADKFAVSTAKYKLSQNYTIDNLDKCLSVYLRWREAQKEPKKVPLWKIAVDLRLTPSALPKPTDKDYDHRIDRRVLAATVSRYLKQARQRIEGVANGVFP
jgi:hypothetical protein